jgi:hypothetical protein
MQLALGVIEKCSVKRKTQISLIQLGIVRWIVNILKEYEELHTYTLEYVTALLMNLSLRSAGKKACLDPDLKVLEVLSAMLSIDNNDIKTYTNGTIYSLLSLAEFKATARVVLNLMNIENESHRQIRKTKNKL